jgi:hypothetical protein
MTKLARNASMAASLAVLAGAIACFAGAAYAAKVSATISLAGQSALPAAPAAGGTVSFAVSATAVKQSDLYYLWVGEPLLPGWEPGLGEIPSGPAPGP